MSRNIEKQKVYQKRYMDRHKMLSVILDKQYDADILTWLGMQDNCSEVIRRALQNEYLKFEWGGIDMDEIRRIIKTYKEEIAEAGSEHKRQDAMIRAFNLILEAVEVQDDE